MTSGHGAFDIRIFAKEGRTLAAAGYRVSIVVPHQRSEVVDGISLVGVAVPRTRWSRFLMTPWKVYLAARRIDASVYHFHDPELMPVAMALALSGRQIVYDVHEDLPRAVLHKAWLPAWLRRCVSAICSLSEAITAKWAAGIIGATPHIAQRFPSAKTTLVQNFPILGELSPGERGPYESRGNVIAYVGAITEERGLFEMISAMKHVALPDARLKMAGRMPDGLKARAEKAALGSKVDVLGQQNRSETRELLASARMGLVLFHPAPNHVNAQPNKLFEYMSAGLPVVASDFPLWREIVGASKCGLLVDPASPDEIAHAINWILANPREAAAMGERGSRAVIEKYNWAPEAERLLSMYARL